MQLVLLDFFFFLKRFFASRSMLCKGLKTPHDQESRSLLHKVTYLIDNSLWMLPRGILPLELALRSILSLFDCYMLQPERSPEEITASKILFTVPRLLPSLYCRQLQEITRPRVGIGSSPGEVTTRGVRSQILGDDVDADPPGFATAEATCRTP